VLLNHKKDTIIRYTMTHQNTATKKQITPEPLGFLRPSTILQNTNGFNGSMNEQGHVQSRYGSLLTQVEFVQPWINKNSLPPFLTAMTHIHNLAHTLDRHDVIWLDNYSCLTSYNFDQFGLSRTLYTIMFEIYQSSIYPVYRFRYCITKGIVLDDSVVDWLFSLMTTFLGNTAHLRIVNIWDSYDEEGARSIHIYPGWIRHLRHWNNTLITVRLEHFALTPNSCIELQALSIDTLLLVHCTGVQRHLFPGQPKQYAFHYCDFDVESFRVPFSMPTE
jgi:hypothetical protein